MTDLPDLPSPCEHDEYGYCQAERHVDCGANCGALVEPETIEELRAAWVHWREHGYLSGCSHGC